MEMATENKELLFRHPSNRVYNQVKDAIKLGYTIEILHYMGSGGGLFYRHYWKTSEGILMEERTWCIGDKPVAGSLTLNDQAWTLEQIGDYYWRLSRKC